MKKVLILAYDFPPYVSVGGLRPYGWFKYFKELGLYPIVITRQWSNRYGNHLDFISAGESNEAIIENSELGTIIRTPYKPNLSNKIIIKYGDSKFRILRKLISGVLEVLQFFFNVGPKAGIYKGAKEFLNKTKVDYIIASAEPFVLFRYAKKLSNRHNIKWIADYRDEWIARLGNNPLKPFYNIVEKRLIKSSALNISASPNYSTNLSKRHNLEFQTVINGFIDNNTIRKNNYSSKEFTISYVGSLYDFQPLEEFIDLIILFLSNTSDAHIKLIFYGAKRKIESIKRIEKLNKHKRLEIEITEVLDQDNLHIKLQQSDLLLLLANPQYIALAAKVFDYLLVKRRIILFKDDKSVLSEIVSNCNAGDICSSEQLKNSIANAYQEWKSIGSVKSTTKNIEQYSRKKQTEKLVKLITNLDNH